MSSRNGSISPTRPIPHSLLSSEYVHQFRFTTTTVLWTLVSYWWIYVVFTKQHRNTYGSGSNDVKDSCEVVVQLCLLSGVKTLQLVGSCPIFHAGYVSHGRLSSLLTQLSRVPTIGALPIRDLVRLHSVARVFGALVCGTSQANQFLSFAIKVDEPPYKVTKCSLNSL